MESIIAWSWQGNGLGRFLFGSSLHGSGRSQAFSMGMMKYQYLMKYLVKYLGKALEKLMGRARQTSGTGCWTSHGELRLATSADCSDFESMAWCKWCQCY